MKKFLSIALLCLLPNFSQAGSIPPNCASDGTKALTYSSSTNAYACTTITSSGGGIPTFSGGTTGLTPNTPTSTAITLGGTLSTANGGTGATTADQALYNLGGGVQRPSGFGWDFTTYPLNIIGNSFGNFFVNFIEELLFPQLNNTQIFVDINTGNDSNSGLTSYANAKKTINAGITAGNALGHAYTLMIHPGIYKFGQGFQTSTAGVPVPTQDVGFVADGGRVVAGVMSDLSWPTTKDATYTNMYCLTRSNVNRVMDLYNNNIFGHYNDIKYYATPSAANSATGNAWNLNGTTLCVKRADNLIPTNTNTRVYLAAPNFSNDSNVSFYFGATTSDSGFDLEGGNVNIITSPNYMNKNIGGRNITARYAGGITAGDSNGHGFRFDNVDGLIIFHDIDASENYDDGFSINNNGGVGQPYVLTWNRSGIHNGDTTDTLHLSVNGFTTHKNVIAIDINGYDDSNFGANNAHIDNTQTWYIGLTSIRAQGDISHTGGNINPYQVWSANTAKIWCDTCKVIVSKSVSGFPLTFAATETSNIYLRNSVGIGGSQGSRGISNY